MNSQTSLPDRVSQTNVSALLEFPELRQQALNWLAITDPYQKAQGVHALFDSWHAGKVSLDANTLLVNNLALPGRPAKPELVPPLAVKRRAMNTAEGRAALMHALTHIEFNAINLALDAVWRFPAMPTEYYADWLQVAKEEAYHFSLLAEHLRSLGYAYGDFPAHNTLWELTEKTSVDVLARMALVPRTMEARGLDATPAVRAKVAQAGDLAGADILGIILQDEIGHVSIGNRWFGYLCRQRELDPIATYASLATKYRAPTLRGPFNLEARREAGFSEDELLALQTGSDRRSLSSI